MARTPTGLEAKLYRNTGTYATPTWVEIENVTDLTCTLTAGEADVSKRGSKYRKTRKTLKEMSVEFDMWDDNDDDDLEAIRTAWDDDSTLDILVLNGDVAVVGNRGSRADVEVFDFSINQPLEEGQSYSVVLKPTDSDNDPVMYEVT